MKSRSHVIALGLGAIVLLGGCQTVRMPNIDFLRLPEFLEDATNIKDFPKVSDAPATPTDIRSADEWDALARDLIAMRQERQADGTVEAATVDSLTPEELEILKARVKAYKLDDPPQ